jgi:hypothetical protein
MNDTITFFGQSFSNNSISSTSIVFSLNDGTSQPTTASFDSTQRIISYSQAPPDASKTAYFTYYLWVNNTEMNGMIHVAYYNGSTHIQIPCNFNSTNEGMRIAATNTGNVYIYGTSANELWLIMTSSNSCSNLTVANAPSFRSSPALVGYNNGFFLQGGMNETDHLLFSDLWQFNGASNPPMWSLVNSNLLTAARHTAVISVLPSPTGSNPNVTIYYTNFGLELVGVYLVSFDLMANMTYYHYNDTNLVPINRIGSLSSVIGNTFFYFLGNYNDTYYNDYYRFVDEKYCTSVMDCEVCVGVYECGWCSPSIPNGPSCVAGNQTKSGSNRLPILSETCANNAFLLSQIESCPELFPSWAIALIVIGGVILVGGIVFGIMKLRSAKPGYDPV